MINDLGVNKNLLCLIFLRDFSKDVYCVVMFLLDLSFVFFECEIMFELIIS